MSPGSDSLSLRPLGQMEQGLFRIDLGKPLNFTTTARITGPLTAEVVSLALPAVRARHVHLRARITHDSRPSFRHDAVRPLEVRVAAGTDWVKELEHEINQPFAEQGPLARFVFVSLGPAESYLLVTLHHSIGDGMSGVFLLRDLIAASAQVLSGQTPALPELEHTAALEVVLPSSARGWRALGHHLRFVARELWMFLRSGLPLSLRRDQRHFADARRTRLIPRQLDAAFTTRLTERARAEKTTVHGALSAAMVLGVLADTGAGKGGITFGSPVNVRAGVVPPVGEQLGFYISMSVFRSIVDARTPFWDLARGIRRQHEATLARNDHLALLDLLPLALSLIGMRRVTPSVLMRRMDVASRSTSGLTNLGRLTIATEHGPLRIEDCHFATCPSALGEFLASATSLNGRVFWNFVWPDPVLTEAHATHLVDGIVDRLKTAVGPV